MPYRVRFTTPDDVPQCAALSRDAVVLSSYENGRRIQKWHEWLWKGWANSTVVVDEADNVVAFGLSLYVSDGLLKQIREGNSQTENELQRVGDPVLAPGQAIKAHQGDGLNLLGFYGWRTDLPPAEEQQMGWLLLQSFLYLHRGLHLKSFAKEVYGQEEVRNYVEMGCRMFRAPEQFPFDTRRHQPYIVGLDRQEMLQTGRVHTHMFGIFCHDVPAVQLRDSQLKIILLAHLLDLSDEKIIGTLKTQEVLVRQRWCRLYDTRDKSGIQWRRSGRNSQRHDFLQFVDRHREIAFPLVIGRWLYKEPELARRFSVAGGVNKWHAKTQGGALRPYVIPSQP